MNTTTEEATNASRKTNGVHHLGEGRVRQSPESHAKAIAEANEAALADLAYHDACSAEIRKALGMGSVVVENAAARTFAATEMDAAIEVGHAAIEAAMVPKRRAARRTPPVRVSTKTGGKKKPSKRLARRSPEQIASLVSLVAHAIKAAGKGLRAEQLRVAIKAQAKEMPRILKTGIATGVLKATGHKRATEYSLKAASKKKA